MKPELKNRLLRLQALNRGAARAYKVENAGQDEATLYLYDVIGYDWWTDGGVTAKQFAKDLAALGNKTLHLRVNSPGGDVFEGRAMATALAAYPGKVIAHVDALAASAASFLIMHADEIEITDGAFMMIHNGWTYAVGDRHAMTEIAALLEKIDGSIANDYHQRTGTDLETIGAWMDEEKWFTAAEAVEAKFADRVAGVEGSTDAKQARLQAIERAKTWNVAAYEHAPAELRQAPAPQQEATQPPPTPTNPDFAAMHAHNLRALRLVETEPA